jgi:hypothetical protein
MSSAMDLHFMAGRVFLAVQNTGCSSASAGAAVTAASELSWRADPRPWSLSKAQKSLSSLLRFQLDTLASSAVATFAPLLEANTQLKVSLRPLTLPELSHTVCGYSCYMLRDAQFVCCAVADATVSDDHMGRFLRYMRIMLRTAAAATAEGGLDVDWHSVFANDVFQTTLVPFLPQAIPSIAMDAVEAAGVDLDQQETTLGLTAAAFDIETAEAMPAASATNECSRAVSLFASASHSCARSLITLIPLILL